MYSADEEGELNVDLSEISEDKKYKLNAYLSTPKFVKALTDVSTFLALRKDL